jgi:hypothetical protein
MNDLVCFHSPCISIWSHFFRRFTRRRQNDWSGTKNEESLDERVVVGYYLAFVVWLLVRREMVCSGPAMDILYDVGDFFPHIFRSE